VGYLPRVDEDACAGHGDCVAIAPDVFELDDIARVIGTGPPELILEAAEACPSVAISVFDEGTGQQVYP
jgi:ferredoxin